ncbi:MAG: hypothetical protein HKN57_10410 [Xanthomonadales bacterium]|nr:hypothetical protein [Xanthomonadales bacterium]
MIRIGLKPRIRLGLDIPENRGGFRREWRFRRSWIAIAVLAVLDAVFLGIAVMTFGEASGEWSRFDSLFDLVGAVFLSAWLLGWSMAPLLMTGILVLMLFGRETLKIRPGAVELTIGLPFVGLEATYDVSKMRNLRLVDPPKSSGTSWRGKHAVFDYGANPIAFGSDVNGEELIEIRHAIRRESGVAVRRGEALPGETEALWDTESESPVAEAAGTDRNEDANPVALGSASTLALIVANLVPVAGAIFLGWNLSDVMVLYWAESAVIGLFNIAKMIVIGRWAAGFAVPFFIGHFGGFMAIHFLFVYTFFVKGPGDMNVGGGSLAEVGLLFASLWPALAALFASHAWSFFSNFMGRGEYRRRKVSDQMSEPYSRIIFMHMVLIFGGGLSMVIGQTAPVLVGVIALKVVFDVRAHLREHAPGKTPKSR